MIYIITDKNGKFVECGMAHIVVVQFAMLNQVQNFTCYAYDDIGVKVGKVDLAATKLNKRLVVSPCGPKD